MAAAVGLPLPDLWSRDAELRARMMEEDVRTLEHAQCLFIFSQILPLCLYYAGTSERPTKFPASLSYTACKVQMIATGIFTLGFNKPGQNRLHNLLHMAGASAYIVDHVVFAVILDMRYVYRFIFVGSFLITGAALHNTSKIKEFIGLPPKYASSPQEWQSMLAVASKVGGPSCRARLWWSEMIFMVFENLIFLSFILGMTSGIDRLPVG
mmetsp:Transcript_106047/g.269335  ORF Transcript_106047/g.269335 Transcript_106047/m.269335 type:complete len:210 (+) Transcript_106047:57-686(+)